VVVPAPSSLRFLQWKWMDELYQAVVESVEEATVNALVANDAMVGRDGHRSPALPRDRVAAVFGDR